MIPNFAREKESIDALADAMRDSTAAQGCDWWAVNVRGHSAAEWARKTARDRSTVARNVRRAEASIDN